MKRWNSFSGRPINNSILVECWVDRAAVDHAVTRTRGKHVGISSQFLFPAAL